MSQRPGGTQNVEARTMKSPAAENEVVSSPPRSDAPAGAPRRRLWPWIVGAAGAALVLFLVTRSGQKQKAQAQTAAGKSQTAARVVPVVAVPARTGDLGVYLTGLGTVSAVNTVTVRSRVDGQLIRVAFREGQLVREGDLLAEIDPRPFQVQLVQAEGQRAKDEAALANAKVDLQRYQVLVQQDAIPRQQLDTQAATVNQLEAALKSDRGGIESAKLNLAYSRITAPITGTVGLKLVDAGNIVHANDPNGIVVITQLQPIAVVFTIPADQLPPLQEQMKTGRKLPVEAWDRDLKNKLATGTLLAVDNQIDSTTGTVRIKALFPNEKGELYSNQFVNARLLVNTLRNTVLIPTAALQRNPQQSTFVWAIKPDSTVEMRNVEVQLTEGDVTSIRRGVTPGEAVVTDGVDKLQAGTKVATGGGGATRPRKAAS
ncbi:MAG: MdtA/MuxA family multidrug efflux RND transporter periplasmic adaptor subunit [Acidobacteriota bacterium]|nr:MdtA/MuxA family multidrug efflux RND transporter periplasmic adaptor subunit [Acidobacteriota bacterium]